MSKEYLEAFESIMKIYGNTNSLEGTYNYFLIIKKALQRLEAIDNSNPSEALECLERIDNTLCLNNIEGKLEFGIDTEEHTDCDSVIGMTEDLDTIKNYILKQQEKKTYLKWEDLKFKMQEQAMKVLLNETEYFLQYKYCYEDDGWMGETAVIKNKEHIIFVFGRAYEDYDIKFFNDLRLERVEE